MQGCSHVYSEAVGKNVANPTAMLLAACNMLNHVGLEYYGNMIQSAVERVLKAGRVSVVPTDWHFSLNSFVMDQLVYRVIAQLLREKFFLLDTH